MSKESISLNDIYANESCQGSVFKAVVMMAQEARYINEQSKLGNIELSLKPTTIAMHKFKENKLEVDSSFYQQYAAKKPVYTADDEIRADLGGDIFAETIAEMGVSEEASLEE